jgi:hypothetical protein
VGGPVRGLLHNEEFTFRETQASARLEKPILKVIERNVCGSQDERMRVNE